MSSKKSTPLTSSLNSSGTRGVGGGGGNIHINKLPHALLIHILLDVHNGVFPSEDYRCCSMVCKIWRLLTPKTLRTVVFAGTNDQETSRGVRSYLLAQEYNETMKRVVIHSPPTAGQTTTTILSALTTPFFSTVHQRLYTPPLTCIELYSTEIKDSEVDLLCDVIRIYNIRTLGLNGVGLNDNQLIVLARALRENHFNQLVELSLPHNQFSKVGLEYLVNTIIETHELNHKDNLMYNRPFFHDSHSSLNTNTSTTAKTSSSNSYSNSNSNSARTSLISNNSSSNGSNGSSSIRPSSPPLSLNNDDNIVNTLNTSNISNRTTGYGGLDNNNINNNQQQQTGIFLITSNDKHKLNHKSRVKNTLKSLDISSNKKLSLDSHQVIQLICKLKMIRTLNLANISLTVEGLQELIQALGPSSSLLNVHSINLCNSGIHARGAEEFAKLLSLENEAGDRCRQMVSLDLSENKLGSMGLKAIVNAILSNSTKTCTSTTCTNDCALHGDDYDKYNRIGNGNGYGRTIPTSIPIPIGQSLRKLYLRRTGIGFEECVVLRNMIYTCKTVDTIDLSSNQINSESVALIGAALSHNQSITKLDLSFNILGEIGCSELGRSLSTNTALRQLYLHCVSMKKEGAIALADGVYQCPTISQLYLSNNDIKNQGCSAFSKCIKSSRSSLNYLDLSFNNISDKGVADVHKAITEAFQQHTIIHLDLCGNQITSKSYKKYLFTSTFLSPSQGSSISTTATGIDGIRNGSKDNCNLM